MQTVQVPLGERSYKIHIGTGLLAEAGELLKSAGLSGKCVLIADENVAPLYGEKAKRSITKSGFSAELITLPAGEKAKDLGVINKVYDKLSQLRIERKCTIVALGGGVVGDAAGFVAATYLRGLPFVQIPTTLLAQVDSSVGGKVGVNLKAGKNLVGSFHQPKLVICDVSTLKTLPEREFRAGMAEVVKYGIIYDADLFLRLEKEIQVILRRTPKVLEPLIARCCEIKADVVSQDETETGLRAILNFGHTIGHALEATAGYGKYLHGEAISIGQVFESEISQKVLRMPEQDSTRVRKLFERIGLPVDLKPALGRKRDAFFDAMALDKKSSGGEVKFVLARKIGEVEFGQKVPRASIELMLGI